MTHSKLLIAVLFTITTSYLSGCGGGGSQSSARESAEEFQLNGPSDIISTVSDGSGRASIIFPVPEGATAISITAESLGNAIKFEKAESSEGVNFLNPNGQTLTTSTGVFPTASAINIPSREQDPNLIPGSLIYVEVSVGSSNSHSSISGVADQQVAFHINQKNDQNFNQGTLAINIFRVGDFSQRSDIVNASEGAANIMKTILASSAGINASVRTFSIPGPAILPSPIDGSSFYLENLQNKPSPAVNLFLGAEISVESFESAQVLGLSAGIPGPSIPTERSLIAISTLAASGVNGTFEEVEINLLGETLAHEVGHYIGLFHPVEITADGAVTSLDPLGDTNTCSSESNCLSKPDLFQNLMFTFPVTDSQGTFIPQTNLTSDQRAVINRYLAVD